MALDDYRTLPGSGLRISPITLGTMAFGQDWGRGASPEESAAILDRYTGLGGNSIDTANIYTNGHSEAIVGDWLEADRSRRDRLILGTKFFGNLHLGDPNGGGTSRKALIRQLEESLRRLRTEWIDIYWIHNRDVGTPIEETLRTLDDLVSDGRIRYVGISDFPAWGAAQAHTIAGFRGWTRPISLQLEYSLAERTSEGELLPMAQELGLAVMPWSPLRGGLLTGKYRVPGAEGRRISSATPEEEAIVERLVVVASEAGISPASAALAWLRSRPAVSSIVIGPRTSEQLVDNLASLDAHLDEGQIDALSRASQPTLPFPHDNNEAVVPLIQYGGSTVDGIAHPEFPALRDSPGRY